MGTKQKAARGGFLFCGPSWARTGPREKNRTKRAHEQDYWFYFHYYIYLYINGIICGLISRIE